VTFLERLWELHRAPSPMIVFARLALGANDERSALTALEAVGEAIARNRGAPRYPQPVRSCC
jgi:hypothetical protein